MLSYPYPATTRAWLLGLAAAAGLWLALYAHLGALADDLTGWLGFERGTRLGEAVHFFFYDTPKVLLLLCAIVFVMGVVQTFFAPERTRALLSGRRQGVGNVLAALLGIVTPFCSCSAVPLFIGFLSSSPRSGLISSRASRSVPASMAMCQKISWLHSWARMLGGQCRPPFCLACRCIPMPQASSRSSRR